MILTSERVDRIVALTSGFVAVLALIVSAYTVHLQREQLRAQVWPRLELFDGNIDGVFLNVVNHGVGPGIIRHVRMTVDGKVVKKWSAALDVLKLQSRPTTTGGINGRVIGAGGEFPVLKIPDTTDEAPIGRMHVELCYCSVVGDCWELGLKDEPELVSACVRTADEFEN